MTTNLTTYTILGATGNIGNRIARELLEKGQKVRVVGRNAARLKSLVDKGAEAVIGSVDDATLLSKAFEGATAVFSMIPPHLTAPIIRDDQNKVSEAIAAALKTSTVAHVVNLSSVGAHLETGSGPIGGLHDHEIRLNKLKAIHILHLRPCYFMENLLVNINTIKHMGVIGSPLKGTLVMPMIATKDIAAIATDALLHLNFTGHTVRELLGERELTMAEVTKIISKSMGRKDITYVQFPYADAEKAMTQMGLGADMARSLIEMNKSMNEGILKPTETRTTENSTPTPLEEFAQVFAEIYGAAEKVPAAR